MEMSNCLDTVVHMLTISMGENYFQQNSMVTILNRTQRCRFITTIQKVQRRKLFIIFSFLCFHLYIHFDIIKKIDLIC